MEQAILLKQIKKEIKMKKLLTNFAFFTLIFNAYTTPVSAKTTVSSGKAAYFRDKIEVQCRSGARCFGINSDLTCDSGAVCTNYGPQQPTCEISSGPCKRLDLPHPKCKWNDGKLSCPGRPAMEP